MRRFVSIACAALVLATGVAMAAVSRQTSGPITTTVPTNGTACTTAGGASCTVIYAPDDTEWLGWTNITITIRNSGANPITDVLVEWSPDNTNWEVWDSTTFAALAAGGIKSLGIGGNSRRFLRIEARSALGATAVVHVHANTE